MTLLSTAIITISLEENSNFNSYIRPMGILDAHWSDRLTGQKRAMCPF